MPPDDVSPPALPLADSPAAPAVHPALAKQLRLLYGDEALSGALAEQLLPLVETVSATYTRADAERARLEQARSAVAEADRDRLLLGRTSDELFRSITESLTEALLITTLDDVVLYANPACATVLGYAPDELVGTRAMDRIVAPEDRAMIQGHNVRRSAGESAHYTVPLLRPDGTRIVAEVSASPVRDANGTVIGTVGAITDITERAQYAAALERSHSLLSAALDSTADAILVVDLAGRVQSWNRRFLELWRIPAVLVAAGADDAALLARVLDQLVDPEEFLRRVRALYADPAAESADVLHFKDGRVVERYSMPQRLRDEVVGRVWSFHDVTARVKAEADLRHAQRLDALGRLAGGVAHDFNNILTTILSSAQLALDSLTEPSRDAELRGDLQEIERSAQRAAELTRQLLAFGRQQILHTRVVQLERVVADSERMLRRVLPEWVHLEVVIADTLWPVRTDVGQIEQVLVNLVVNARDAMPSGGTLCIALENRRGALADGRDAVALVIRDDGAGMDVATQARIFEPFFTTKQLGEGTGLGLATVHGIVEQLAGEVHVSSELGRGTTMTVLLPALPDGAASGIDEEVVVTESPARSAGTVLLVEDELPVRQTVSRILERCGFRVLETTNGLEALAALREHRHAIDLVISDVVMPAMGGLELVRRLRDEGDAIPVLLVSGYAREVVAFGELPAGPVRFLQKPFATRELLEAARELVAANTVGAPADR